jgi:UMF1 family MFS transporter
MTLTSTQDAPATSQSAGALAIGSWMLFDWAAQPFYTLITTFIFAPYFTAHFIGDAVRGPALWGYTMAATAILVALGGPILGAIADARGRLKSMIALLSLGFIGAQALLWYAKPGASENLWLIIFALIVATVTAEFSAILNNSLMPRLIGPERFGRVSGGGWALGYAGGLISLVLFLIVFQFSKADGNTLLGFAPIFPSNSPAHEADRIVGPVAALWFAIFVIPFFLFTPDAPPKAGGGKFLFRAAISSLFQTLRNIQQYRNLALFFLARMLFVDGLLAIFAFGGIYATILFGWQTTQLGIFGIILSVAAGIGAMLGGFFDDKLGSRPVVQGALLLLIAGATGIISIDNAHIFFFLELPPAPSGAELFASTGERAYLGFAILIGLAAGPLQSASRSLLARMAPLENLSEFFGFFAFSGKVTAFAAPLAVSVVADSTGSLRIGMSAILLFLFGGLILMVQVRTERA